MEYSFRNISNRCLKSAASGFLCFLFFTIYTSGISAQRVAQGEITKIITATKNLSANLPIEKLHLQLDKPWYTVGDTIWFKGYLFDASYLSAGSLSGLVYIELVNDSNKVIKRMMLPVNIGLTWGNIALTEKEISQGNYTLRAYTNWMLNFGEYYIFRKSFFVSNPTERHWLVNLRTELLKDAGKGKVGLHVRLTNSPNLPVSSREMELKVLEANKTLYQDAVSTNQDGFYDVNFNLPEKNPLNLALTLQDLKKGERNQKLFIPLILNRPEYSDLQFMPESGNLVNGLPASVGFKAIGEDGKGINISGKILNSKGREVTSFKSAHKGMGSFSLLPEASESYTASIILPNGNIKAYPLPMVKNSGTVLSVLNQEKSDSVTIIISCTPDIAATNQNFYLIGQSRGVVCLGASISLNKDSTKFIVSKNAFPTGIARFTLLGPDKQPLNERIVFINHDDNLRIEIIPDKTSYAKRDSVALHIRVTDKDDVPVQSSLSLAVTDNSQVSTDSSTENSIVSDILLTSDLKGNVEDPEYYLQHASNPEAPANLDNLMLTQGWVGYNWNTVFNPLPHIEYEAEPDYSIKGKVTNVFNKPVSNAGIVLLSRKPMLVKDTVTNASGIFTFNNIFPADSAVFLLQARNKKGKSFNVGIEVEEFKPPVFANKPEHHIPWYVNIDTTRLSAFNNQALLKQEQEKSSGGVQMLKEVFVIGKKIIKDSKNLNGPGEADITLTEADLNKAGKVTLRDLLTKNVKGFGLGGKTGRNYVINGMLLHLVIDGTNVDMFKPDAISRKEYFDTYLDYYTAEDIKGVEVMKSAGYQMRYSVGYLDPLVIPWDHTFVEVTTHGGQGPFLKKVPGVYLYRPLAFSTPSEFYAPKYTVSDTSVFTDIRSTIHWVPNIITDKEGKATVSFYTADHPGTYTIIAEGSDMSGNVGAQRQKIVVKIP